MFVFRCVLCAVFVVRCLLCGVRLRCLFVVCCSLFVVRCRSWSLLVVRCLGLLLFVVVRCVCLSFEAFCSPLLLHVRCVLFVVTCLRFVV